MWSVSTIAVFCVLLELGDGMQAANDLEMVFSDRTQTDWENVWHKEKYSRCRETLVKHLYWACEKDIYRLTKRSDPNRINYVSDYENVAGYPWLAPTKAKKILRYRRGLGRRSASSITSECCKSSGCTWEEYAEYCPTNKRHTNSYTSYV